MRLCRRRNFRVFGYYYPENLLFFINQFIAAALETDSAMNSAAEQYG